MKIHMHEFGGNTLGIVFLVEIRVDSKPIHFTQILQAYGVGHLCSPDTFHFYNRQV